MNCNNAGLADTLHRCTLHGCLILHNIVCSLRGYPCTIMKYWTICINDPIRAKQLTRRQLTDYSDNLIRSFRQMPRARKAAGAE